ncbi:hypothetical protein K488DRAFT_51831 [Vararia minispora EC-137]|uniref:Uncharacterized protein n=1 Tax=Vararia minispora EC-137 TaxID=1314806 RepID=A0ACB8QIY2_9AGAM|nr:hypothetical protein K488DRAFT_51831 [Vararia minispora EC-137]
MEDLNIPLFFASLILSAPIILDINSRPAIDAVGVSLASNTISSDNVRSSVRDRIIGVRSAVPQRLTLQLDTLATKVLLCQDANVTQPRAYGVEIAEGAGLPVQAGFEGKQTLQTKQVLVKREVIVSAGVFQTPQLLTAFLGDSNQLTSMGIDPVVNLPGVGLNLQGLLHHDEIATTWTLKSNFSLFNGCTFGSDPSTDPCLQYWLESNHQNLYSFGSAIFHAPYKTDDSLSDPDMMHYWLPANFPGFVRGAFPPFLPTMHMANRRF